ncbi:MAG: NAD-dependent protein deacetylase [Gammaproteobacteria bacterium]|nr:NAD-dependent protein deacetylase [Gammaproteobacteria bacterium]
MAPQIRSLGTFLSRNSSLAILSGAGVSTASGIPDYRDRDGKWKQAQPMQFGDFVASAAARRRYWARSFVGWQRFSIATPNPAHQALADLESSGKVDTLITQNVDGLHSAAGSRRVIDLHGDLRKVRCLDCGLVLRRADYQEALEAANPGWHPEARALRADGDAELGGDDVGDFRVLECRGCGGTMKPDVVMFGESVPKNRVRDAMEAVDRADALLVVGSSLMVFSGYRFARHASASGKPIAIVNQGCTRADDIASLKVDGDCAQILPAVIAAVAA